MPSTYYQHGNTIASFGASVTQNTIQMHQWHEMESTVHSQFGTVDNPVLIFTSDSSWRIVICMGPGIEDDAHSHEKIYYMAREGPMNRCLVCGQCWKIVRLRDEYSEEMDYYGMMFSTMSHFDVSEEDMAINLTSFFGDRPQATMQTIPTQNIYVEINNDESARILVDPAYKLERTKEVEEKLMAMNLAFREADRQMAESRLEYKLPTGRDIYETWVNVELSIMRFDRLFNKIEKFEARKFSDPDNHDRRERRMQERRQQRTVENYAYFFGNLTEEEQQYRDYFETDLELDPEDPYIEDETDRAELAMRGGEFDPARFDFIETTLNLEPHENFEDLVEDKIFKYKYRQFADHPDVFARREARRMQRFQERAVNRDKRLEASLYDIYQADAFENSYAQMALDGSKFRNVADEETAIMREYMANESLQQYRDYYESDAEEQRSFEYLDNLDNRSRIRFMEIFEDPTIRPANSHRGVALISKREFNPELSGFSNFVLNLVDFKDRVRPMANDLALLDASYKYQRDSADEVFAQQEEMMNDMGLNRNPANTIEEATPQSAGEISEGSDIPVEEEPVAAEAEVQEEEQAAEPEQEQAAEETEEKKE